ncbi:PadR family transcriptional regulator [Natranaerofaba carboxydovora]|uniref:PadR family transcriptional regulator n=1 Tax=Natranaerofaba carboxydovora TaxID=2742683 RepID=UPI001F12E1F1|nr:PadR family transcriptional regulator [Natranaerofaba carboxydovora]UMZ72738.1 Transcriptional regulator PadR-like family protein [Natranaerofaba carboxydovora]
MKNNQVLRKLFLGFIQLHILYHAKNEPFFGAWMIEELKEHGYDISPGTLYPILHNMEKDGLLKRKDKIEYGKVRKYYTITQLGEDILEEGKEKAKELFREINH